MRRAALLLVPLFLFACDRESVAPEIAPSLNASGEHRALVVSSTGVESYLFDGSGEIVLVTCRDHQVYTNNNTGRVNISSSCVAENPSRKAAKFTPDDNPFMPGLCAGWTDPDGNFYLLCDWQEVISASGNIMFHMQGTPIY